MKTVSESLPFTGPEQRPAPDAHPGTLTSSAVHGLKWSYASSLAIGLLQIGLTAVLARLLEPKAFGLVAMAGVALRFGSYFAQMGMTSAIVQKPVLTLADVRLAFTFATALSLLFFFLFWLGTPVATWFFDTPELGSLLPVMAVSFVLTGVSATAIGLLRRDFKFHILGIGEILGYVLGYGIVGIWAAYGGAGAWSLVYASLTQSGVIALVVVGFTRHEMKPLFSWKRGNQLASFGGKVSVIGFLEFISSNLDVLAIGKILGAAQLGLYNRAFMLVNVPMQYLSSSLSRVLLPSFSRIQNEQERLDRSFRSAILLMGALLFPLCFGIAGGAREIVLAILGEQWKESIPILRILALSTPFMLLSHVEAVLLEATAKLTVKLYIQVGNILLLGTLFLLLLSYGLTGLASAVLLSNMGLFVAYTAALKILLSVSQKNTYLNLLPGALSGLVILVVLLVSSEIMARFGLNIVGAFIAQLLLGASMFYLLLICRLQNAVRTEIESLLSKPAIQSPLCRACQRVLWL